MQLKKLTILTALWLFIATSFASESYSLKIDEDNFVEITALDESNPKEIEGIKILNSLNNGKKYFLDETTGFQISLNQHFFQNKDTVSYTHLTLPTT